MEEFRRPESVLVVVYTAKGSVLLLRRAGARPFWQSVTGSLRVGESPAGAARRELLEETGIADDGRLVDRRISNRFPILPEWGARFPPGTTDNLEHLFTLELAHPCAVHIDPGEHSEWEWAGFAAAIERVWSWTNRAGIRLVQAEWERNAGHRDALTSGPPPP